MAKAATRAPGDTQQLKGAQAVMRLRRGISNRQCDKPGYPKSKFKVF